MQIVRFLLEIVFTLFSAALILRAWMRVARVHPRNPLSQPIAAVTDWLVMPLRRVIPSQNIDWASLTGAWLAGIAFVVAGLLLSGLSPLSALPTVLGLSFLMVVKWSLNLVVWITLVQAILSWVNPQAPMMPLLQAITAPLLNPIRRVIPAPGGFDLSPLIVIVLAQVGMMILSSLSYSLMGL